MTSPVVEPPRILPLSFGSDVLNEGAFGQLSCVVTEGDQPLSLSWSFHGAELSSDLDIVTTPIGRRGSMLIIARVGHEHSGSYSCQATNSAGSDSQTAHLYVNGNSLYSTGRHRRALEGFYFSINFEKWFLLLPLF